METPEYFHGGYYRAGTPQHAPEKPGKSGGGDHFIVDDLLDFSHEEEEDEAGRTDGASDAAAGNSTDSSGVTAVDSCCNSSSGPDPHVSGALVCRSFADASLSGDLCEPQYDEQLEWLSNFVEESFSSEDLEKLQIISGIKASSSSSGIRSQISDRTNHSSPFLPEGPVPGKARSKRSRAVPCSWSSSPLIAVSPAAPATTSTLVCDALVPSNPFTKLPKPAKKNDPSAGPEAWDGRKCLHCATEKTPQWRTGPMGPKTLCNACGVRYKSGRLVPEYRPAASPTFVLSKHSNSHRKVIELRRQKEQPQFLHPGAAAVYDGAGSSAGDGFLIRHRVGPDFRLLN